LKANTAASFFSALTTSRADSLKQKIPSSAESVANLLSIPPIHVDTVAEAVCRSIEDQELRGVVGVSDMKAMMEGKQSRNASNRSSPQPSI
jgi:hypothetical protein